MLALFAFGLSTILVLLLIRLPLDGNYTFVVILWLTALIAYAIAVIPVSQMKALAHLPRGPMVLMVSAIGAVALALRVWHLDTIPFSLAGDEASQGLEALRVINGSIRSPFVTGWASVPTMSFFLDSVSLRVFGATVSGLRLPWVLVGTLTVLVTSGFVTRLVGPRLGLLTAGLLAVYHFHIHFSRLGSVQVADPLFVVLALLFLYRALACHRAFDWAMMGAATAASMYFYAGARLTGILVVAAIGYEAVHDRRRFWQTHRVGLVIACGAFLVAGAPMLQYALRFPDEFNARVNQVGIFQNGWIELAKQVTGRSVPELLLDQFRRAALAFNFYPDRTVWYGLRQPLLDPLFGSLFLLGLGYATLRTLRPRGDRRLFPMVAWWWGAAILGGMLTESPPSSMRLVTLTVPVCFFIALAAFKLIGLTRRAISGVPVNALLLATFVVFAGISIKTYFVDYTPLRIYGGPRAEAATIMAPTLRALSATHHFYFVGAPFMGWNFATLLYLVPNAEVTDITGPITAAPSPALIPPEKGAVFIFVPERAAEMGFVQQTWQQGRVLELHSSMSGQLLALLYVVAP